MSQIIDDEKFAQFIRGEISEQRMLGLKVEGEFKVGDRIIGLAYEQDGVNLYNKVGTVVEPSRRGGNLGIKFDERHPEFHSLNGQVPHGHGYFVDRRKVRHL